MKHFRKQCEGIALRFIDGQTPFWGFYVRFKALPLCLVTAISLFDSDTQQIKGVFGGSIAEQLLCLDGSFAVPFE